jgi:integrase
LEVASTGSKRWFWKYYFDGKEKRLAIGSYPATKLKDARTARDEARRVQQQGLDPAQHRRLQRFQNRSQATTTFEAVARELHATQAKSWSKRYAAKWIERMEKDLFPWIGNLPLAAINAPVLLDALRRVEKRGASETAHTLRQTAGQVFRFGIATGRCDRNPAPDLQGALVPVHAKHVSAILDPQGAAKLMDAMWHYEGQPTTRAALVLSALLFQRPGNVRHMEWDEIDLEEGLWTIPSAKMKRRLHEKLNGRPHLVPLAPVAVELLRDLRPLTGSGRYVFPSLHGKGRPMSENTIRTALRRLGYTNDEMTPHGFRAMARTIMVERLGIPADVVEAQLAHTKAGPLGAAYDRAEYLDQRKEMMVAWAGFLLPGQERPRDVARQTAGATLEPGSVLAGVD